LKISTRRANVLSVRTASLRAPAQAQNESSNDYVERVLQEHVEATRLHTLVRVGGAPQLPGGAELFAGLREAERKALEQQALDAFEQAASALVLQLVTAAPSAQEKAVLTTSAEALQAVSKRMVDASMTFTQAMRLLSFEHARLVVSRASGLVTKIARTARVAAVETLDADGLMAAVAAQPAQSAASQATQAAQPAQAVTGVGDLAQAFVAAFKQVNQERKASLVCFWCAETGHMQWMCPMRKAGKPAAPGSMAARRAQQGNDEKNVK
jgi:hypothetical protein